MLSCIHPLSSPEAEAASVLTWATHDDVNMNNGVEDKISEPRFDPKQPRNITAIDGREVRLTCRVYNSGNETVSEPKKESKGLPGEECKRDLWRL